ncbi:MAG: ABC transporter ATP-binding protein [Nitrospina sp.]|nr:ABC transporter ATP-binding protein [Nitrospina sp.]MBT6716226.1 ABC transporter ATP-binding protein [Nitrospina sp.]
MKEDSVIKIRDVHFSYGGPPILENIELDIQAKEFVGMVGPNGSGKTTLLRIILGLINPDRGSVEVLGKPAHQGVKEIGYMPQLTPFSRDFPISVEETVLMGRLGKTSSIGLFSKEDKRLAAESMEAVEVLDLSKRPIGSLSGGQLQRVLIARALTCNPEIMILDEPTANVDMKVEKDIFDLLKKLNEKITIIVVTHDIGFISQYITKVACINRTLICHPTSELTGETIEKLYGTHVHMVHHHHEGEDHH